MSEKMTIDVNHVEEIANKLEKTNEQLHNKLLDCKTEVNKLRYYWQGAAAEATIESFNEFAKKYFDMYKQVVEDYIRFLRVNVVEGYTEVEMKNQEVSESYR